jgi:hypothetical protein
MSTDEQIDRDLTALAESTRRGLPTIDETARALAEARAKRERGNLMQMIRKPLWLTSLVGAAVAAVLLFPVPYSHTVGYDLTLRSPGGREAKVKLSTRDPRQAARRAAALQKPGTTVTVTPRTERVWGSVYAMAKEKLLTIQVDFDGKSDTQIADEIRDQLTQAGWSAGDVQVQRTDEGSTVSISTDDGAGRQMRIERRANGPEKQMHLELGGTDILDGIEIKRDPRMTDDQLRDKIVKQLQARGLDAQVKVTGDQIEVRAVHQSTEEE